MQTYRLPAFTSAALCNGVCASLSRAYSKNKTIKFESFDFEFYCLMRFLLTWTSAPFSIRISAKSFFPMEKNWPHN